MSVYDTRRNRAILLDAGTHFITAESREDIEEELKKHQPVQAHDGAQVHVGDILPCDHVARAPGIWALRDLMSR